METKIQNQSKSYTRPKLLFPRIQLLPPQRRKNFFIIIIFSLLFIPVSCNIPLSNNIKTKNLPHFNSDSAYKILKTIVSFGPRVPNSIAHRKLQQFIISYLQKQHFSIDTQSFITYRFDSVKLNLCNIIARFNPKAKKRILIFTHYDTRFMADNDTNPALKHKPIPGANDSGSGVAIMLELAKIINHHKPKIGIDLIFFDGEDQGPPSDQYLYDMKYWALGSKYWAKHYKLSPKPLYGINIDMVAGKNAKFAIENFSLYYYGYLAKRIWKIAQNNLNCKQLFINKRTSGIFDDHVQVNRLAHIRSILIIENHNYKHFPNYWHTHNDSLNIISKKTIKCIGNLLLTIIYNQS